MNKLVAEGFILHRKDGTEERIVRDVEIRAVEPKPDRVIGEEVPFYSGRVYQGRSLSREDILSVRDQVDSWDTVVHPLPPNILLPQAPSLIPERLFNRIEDDEWQQRRPERIATALGLSVDEIMAPNQTTEIERRTEPPTQPRLTWVWETSPEPEIDEEPGIIFAPQHPETGNGLSVPIPLAPIENQNSTIREIFDLSNRIIRTEQQPTFIVTGTGVWNPYSGNPSEWGPVITGTGINDYWTGTDQTSIPIEESNPKLKWFLDRIFRGQMPTLFVEPLDEWNEEEINYLSFEELIYTSDDERQFRIKNIQVRSRNGKFNIICGENTSISEITRGRSHLFVCLDEEIEGMIKE